MSGGEGRKRKNDGSKIRAAAMSFFMRTDIFAEHGFSGFSNIESQDAAQKVPSSLDELNTFPVSGVGLGILFALKILKKQFWALVFL
jgi:hypothetical protein